MLANDSRWQSLDCVCYLINTVVEQDEIGNEIEVDDSEEMCFCAESSVRGSEFYSAGQAGIKAAVVLSIDKGEYSGQHRVRYNEETFNVYRTYIKGERLELHLSALIGGGSCG